MNKEEFEKMREAYEKLSDIHSDHCKKYREAFEKYVEACKALKKAYIDLGVTGGLLDKYRDQTEEYHSQK